MRKADPLERESPAGPACVSNRIVSPKAPSTLSPKPRESVWRRSALYAKLSRGDIGVVALGRELIDELPCSLLAAEGSGLDPVDSGGLVKQHPSVGDRRIPGLKSFRLTDGFTAIGKPAYLNAKDRGPAGRRRGLSLLALPRSPGRVQWSNP